MMDERRRLASSQTWLLRQHLASRARTPPPSPTRTPPCTPSPTTSAPLCRGLPAVLPLTGTTGTAPALSTAASGNPGMYTSGSCAAGFRTFYPGPRLVFSLFLGLSAPLGGTLTVTTCGQSRNNTVLYIGTGCPTWDRPFGCLAGADDVGGAACGSNPFASTVRITANQRNFFIQVRD